MTANVDIEAAKKLAEKVKSGSGFDLQDFLGQLQQMKQMGGLSSLMDKLPTQMAAKACEHPNFCYISSTGENETDAFLAVPITACIMMILAEFSGSRPIAVLLSQKGEV